MSDRKPQVPDKQPIDEYQTPEVESHLEADEIEREVAYAGVSVDMADTLINDGQ